MSLASQISALATRIGQEVKAVRTESAAADPVRSFSKIKCYTYDPVMTGNVSGVALISGTLLLCKMPVLVVEALSGLIIPVSTQGNYTAASTGNRVGLYRSDGTTLTLVASSAEDGTLWKGSGGTNADRAFSSPYTPASTSEHIYGAYLYRNTAQVTAPAVHRLQYPAALVDIGAAGGFSGQHRSGSITSQTDLPATLAVTSVAWGGGSGQPLFWMGAY